MPTPRFADVTRNIPDPRQVGAAYNVVFIPWEWADAQEWVEKTSQWNHVTANKYRIVVYIPRMRQREIYDANDHTNAAIYIRGHGAAGVADIQVKVGPSGNQVEKKLRITEACDRLIESGLKTSFAGAVKFFHCYSGTVMTGSGYTTHKATIQNANATLKQGRDQGLITGAQYRQWKKPLQPNKSIARTGADYMRDKGYVNCIYFGYLGPLESEYADDGTGNWHKQVSLDNLQSAGPVMSTTRASLGRVQV